MEYAHAKASCDETSLLLSLNNNCINFDELYTLLFWVLLDIIVYLLNILVA